MANITYGTDNLTAHILERLSPRHSNTTREQFYLICLCSHFIRDREYSTVLPRWRLPAFPSTALWKKMKNLIAFWCIPVRFSIKRKRWYVHTICQKKKKWRKCWQFHYTLVMGWSELTYYKIKKKLLQILLVENIIVYSCFNMCYNYRVI